MSGDFTRNSFDPAKFYSAVRMQQGRLFTDATGTSRQISTAMTNVPVVRI